MKQFHSLQSIAISPFLFLMCFSFSMVANAQLSVQIKQYECGPANVQMIAEATGGIPPYTYAWNITSDAKIYNVVPFNSGLHTVTVTDAANNQTSAGENAASSSADLDFLEITGPANTCNSGDYTVNLNLFGISYKWDVIDIYNNVIYSQTLNGTNTITNLWNNVSFIGVSYVVVRIGSNDELKCPLNPVRTEVLECCNSFPNSVFFDKYTLNNDVSYTNRIIEVNNKLTLNANLELHNCTVYMGPKASIEVLSGKSFRALDATTIQRCTDYMWDSIYGSAGSTIEIVGTTSQNAIVRDGICAVASFDGATLAISNTSFIDNYESVVVYNSSVIPCPVNITGCIFKNTGPNHKLLYPPYVNSYSSSGINARFVNDLIIGDENRPSNDFSYMLYGIYTDCSMAEIRNNRFHDFNMPTGLLGFPPKHAAVKSNWVSDASVQWPPILTVGGSPASTNTFENCFYGIFSYGFYNDIDDNHFTNCTNSIYCLDFLQPSFIVSNKINISPAEYDMIGTGIVMENAFTPPSGDTNVKKLRIQNNEIFGMGNGISLINNAGNHCEDTNIIHNSIKFINDLPAAFKRTGIRVQGCDAGAGIFDNHIWKVQTNVDETMIETYKGIWVSQSNTSHVMDNTIERMGSGIFTTGNCWFTQFYCNDLIDNWHGFYFSTMTHISNQSVHSSHLVTDNKFEGYTISTQARKMSRSTDGWNGPMVKWYVHDSLPVFHILNFDIPLLHPLDGKIDKIGLPNEPNECENGLPDNSETIDSLTRDEMFGNILRNENYYPFLNDQYHFYENQFLYKYFSEDTNAIFTGSLEDSVYQAYLDSLSGTDVGKTNELLRYIYDNEYTSALAKANELYCSVWNDNMRNVADIYINTWAGGNFELSSQDSAVLWPIAMMTPYEGGNAVYTARVMLHIDPEDYNIPYSAPIPYSEKPVNSIKVYPNPANDEAFIEIDNYSGTITIEVFNTVGKIVTAMNSISKENIISLNTNNLINGIYFIRVYCNEKQLGIGKMIIQK